MMFCGRPFENYYITADGNVHLCCPEWMNLTAGNIITDDPKKIWISENARKMRFAILNGSFSHCTNCPHLPGPSGCVYEAGNLNPTVDIRRIKTLTIAYDSTCNLACPSCRSSKKPQDEKARLIQQKLVDSNIFESVNTICTSGSGDPFASRLFWELLETLQDPKYNHLTFSFQTNGLLLTEATLDRLSGRFYRTDFVSRIENVLVSVDAASKDTYFMNRGGNFELLLDNLYRLRDRGMPIQINMVVQRNNFREMFDFVCLGDALNAFRIYFSALENWGTYESLDYLDRAVHRISHPDHQELLSILQDPIFHDRSRITLAGLPRP